MDQHAPLPTGINAAASHLQMLQGEVAIELCCLKIHCSPEEHLSPAVLLGGLSSSYIPAGTAEKSCQQLCTWRAVLGDLRCLLNQFLDLVTLSGINLLVPTGWTRTFSTSSCLATSINK